MSLFPGVAKDVYDDKRLLAQPFIGIFGCLRLATASRSRARIKVIGVLNFTDFGCGLTLKHAERCGVHVNRMLMSEREQKALKIQDRLIIDA